MKNSAKKWLKIGVLGGMGPVATLEFYKNLLQICQTQYGCIQDDDFPQIIINSIPLVGFTEKGIEDEGLVKNLILTEAKKMQEVADFIVVPCNTVHYFYDEISTQINIPWLSLIQIIFEKITFTDVPVALLSSEFTKESGLYKNLLAISGMPFIETTSDQQTTINGVIEKVMSSQNTIHDNHALNQIMKEMLDVGAKSILLGCTELPIAHSNHFNKLKVYDSLDILAHATLEYASVRF